MKRQFLIGPLSLAVFEWLGPGGFEAESFGAVGLWTFGRSGFRSHWHRFRIKGSL